MNEVQGLLDEAGELVMDNPNAVENIIKDVKAKIAIAVDGLQTDIYRMETRMEALQEDRNLFRDRYLKLNAERNKRMMQGEL